MDLLHTIIKFVYSRDYFFVRTIDNIAVGQSWRIDRDIYFFIFINCIKLMWIYVARVFIFVLGVLTFVVGLILLKFSWKTAL